MACATWSQQPWHALHGRSNHGMRHVVAATMACACTPEHACQRCIHAHTCHQRSPARTSQRCLA
eukprot:358056-Chlamydomonas_euryale.AAC.1